MSGRKPMGPNLKLLHGGEPSRGSTDIPSPGEAEPVAPPWLTLAQLDVWDQIVEELREMQLLYRADGMELVNLVTAITLCQRMARTIEQEGVVVPGANGVSRPHPLLPAYERGLRAVHVMAGAFGLHPAGRASLHLTRIAPAQEDTNESFGKHFTAM